MRADGRQCRCIEFRITILGYQQHGPFLHDHFFELFRGRESFRIAHVRNAPGEVVALRIDDSHGSIEVKQQRGNLFELAVDEDAAAQCARLVCKRFCRLHRFIFDGFRCKHELQGDNQARKEERSQDQPVREP
jgi:hypothetical protein